MDEHELEARLGARLHRRFDRAEAPDRLRAGVGEAMRRPDVRAARSARSMWSLAAAAVIVVAFVGITLRFGLPGPAATASPAASAPPSAAPGTTIVYQLQPLNGQMPGAGDLVATRQILEKRLTATGIVGFSVQARSADQIVVTLPVLPDISEVRRLLVTTGKLEFVPLPVAGYGSQTSPGPQTAVEGQPLPTSETPLFGGESITRAYATTDSSGLPAVGFQLDATGTSLFATYTTNSVGQFLAIVMDDTVVSAPFIQSAITGGDGIISTSAGFTAAEMHDLVTILTFGALPFPLAEASITTPSTPASASPTASLGAIPTPSGGQPTVLAVKDCAKQPVHAVLHLDAADPRQIWGTDLDTGRDIAVRPRQDTGWRVVAGQTTRLVDAANHDAGFDGDIFHQACFDPATNTFSIGPDDLPSPNRGAT